MDTNMNSGTFKVARIGGVEIKVHWSWLIIVFLISFELAMGYFPTHLPTAGGGVYWVLGVITALLLFASVLLHELSHSFVARAQGIKVRDITLFIFGGASNIEQEPKRARDEFSMAIVGPLTSLVLAAIFFAIAQIISPASQVGIGAIAVLHDLAFLNLLLGLFNLIPGFPLDGGRVLRSIIWAFNHNQETATRSAALIGQLVAYGFIFWGLFETFLWGDFGGLWIALIGWFLLNAATQSVAQVQMQRALRGITIGQVMRPTPETVSPQATVAYLLAHFVLPNNLRYVPVAEEGRFEGLVTLRDIKDVPQEQWATVTVAQVMVKPGNSPANVAPNDPLEHGLQVLEQSGQEQLSVVDASGRLTGVLERERTLRWLQIRDTLKLGAVVSS